jgi:hypothetical protein
MDLDKIIMAQRAWQAAKAAGGAALQKSAEEALTNCAAALETLCANLESIGYVWAGRRQVHIDQVKQHTALIEDMLEMPVPPVLQLFWEQVGGISLVDLDGYRHTDFWSDREIEGPHGFCDGLYVNAPTKEWTAYVCDNYSYWQEFGAGNSPAEFVLDLSPDGYHKDNFSGGAPYGLCPGSSWTPIWQHFEWGGAKRPLSAPPDPPDFLTYLRTAILECGGFSGLYGVPQFEPVRVHLLDGLPVF